MLPTALMPTIDRTVVHDRYRIYITRYHQMRNSINPEDKANAEACLIASQVFSQIEDDFIADCAARVALTSGVSAAPASTGSRGPGTLEHDCSVPALDPDKYSRLLLERWTAYCEDYRLAIVRPVADTQASVAAGLVQADGKPVPEPAEPEQETLAEELRPYVRRNFIDSILSDLCHLLRLPAPDRTAGADYTAAGDDVRPGLHRSTPAEVAAARANPPRRAWFGLVQRDGSPVNGPSGAGPDPAAASVAARPTPSRSRPQAIGAV